MSSVKDQETVAILIDSATEDLLQEYLTLIISQQNENYAVLSLTCPEEIQSEVAIATKAKSVSCLLYDEILKRTYELCVAASSRHEDQYTPSKQNMEDDNSVAPKKLKHSTLKFDELDRALVTNKNEKTVILLNFPIKLIHKVCSDIDQLPPIPFYLYTKDCEKNNLSLLSEKEFEAIGIDYTGKNLKQLIRSRGADKSIYKYKIGGPVTRLGLDISLSSTGIAAECYTHGCKKILVGRLTTKPEKCDFSRARVALRNLKYLPMRCSSGEYYIIDITRCPELCLEGGALDAVQGAYRLGRYSGMFISQILGTNITEIAPSRLKKLVTGYGASGKDYVQRKAKEKLGLKDFDMNEDEGDALALLYCLINKANLPELSPVKVKKPRKAKTAKKSGGLAGD